jgi:hypothetical protein
VQGDYLAAIHAASPITAPMTSGQALWGRASLERRSCVDSLGVELALSNKASSILIDEKGEKLSVRTEHMFGNYVLGHELKECANL